MVAVVIMVMVMVMVMVMIAPVIVIVVMLVIMLIASLVAVLVIPRTRPLQFATPRQFLFAVTLGRGSVGVPWVIFSGPDEVNGSVTGIVLVAMQPPRMRVFGRNMQVEGLDDNVRRRRLYDHGTREDHRRRGALAQVHAPVNARNDLSPDSDAEIQVTGMRDLTQRAGRKGKKDGPSQQFSHFTISTARSGAASLILGPGGARGDAR